MRKIVPFFLALLVLIAVQNTSAKIDFSKNYKYYEATCSKRTSYEINKQACLEFEKYKKDNKSQVAKMEGSVNDSNLTADKLATLVNENTALINKKTIQIRAAQKRIIDNQKRVKVLDKEVLNGLGAMQYVSDQNQVVDIIMASSNLEDLMTRIDGLSTINKANVEAVLELEKVSKELDDTKKYIQSDIKKLKQTKIKQRDMLFEFRRKEADLYSSMNSGGSGATYNSSIEKLKLSKMNDKSKTWARPMRHGNVSAGTWYYPGGGGWHPGLDVANGVGTNIVAPANGALLATSSEGSYGKHILTVFKKDKYVYTMLFAHLSDFVGVNGFSKGATIAKSGNTGNSTGPHVHVEVMRHNTSNVAQVVNQYKKQKDYWFGLGYQGKGNCDKVCRLQPESVFKLKVGTNY